MASSSYPTIKLSLKLLIDTENEKVLFAEASKPVIDFLFNLLCLPIGTVVKLLSVNGMVGSLGNLYESVENLDQEYMLPNQTTDFLLNPKAQSSSTEIARLLTHNDDHEGTKLYMCRKKCKFEVTYDNTTRCTAQFQCTKALRSEVPYIRDKNVKSKKCKNKGHKRTSTENGLVCGQYMDREVHYTKVCGRYMDREVHYIKNGFVKDDETFLAMDDLVIQPMSTISSTITLLNHLNVKEIVTFQEKVVEMGMDEVRFYDLCIFRF